MHTCHTGLAGICCQHKYVKTHIPCLARLSLKDSATCSYLGHLAAGQLHLFSPFLPSSDISVRNCLCSLILTVHSSYLPSLTCIEAF